MNDGSMPADASMNADTGSPSNDSGVPNGGDSGGPDGSIDAGNDGSVGMTDGAAPGAEGEEEGGTGQGGNGESGGCGCTVVGSTQAEGQALLAAFGLVLAVVRRRRSRKGE
jgi:MYXO-CTERM domain-containing protein